MNPGTGLKMLAVIIGATATAALAQVIGPPPTSACLTDEAIDGGACSKWTDSTDPETCPDEVISSDECRRVVSATSGFRNKTGYDSFCTMRIRTWNSATGACQATIVPPVKYRCYEATGPVCGSGCGGGC
jgi:hypothetical protein